jgi:hypothetical protein
MTQLQLDASGPFNVTVTPTGDPDRTGCTQTGRMLLDKQYFGDLSATGRGQMLTAVTDTKGSAAYVAIETISGTLGGREGSFAIQHAGSMGGGAEHIAITIVPDSGSGQLVGISGTMSILREEGKHAYALRYTLPQE